MRKFKLDKLRLSTKILIAILVFVISVGGTLAVIYRDQLSADIPEPQNQEQSVADGNQIEPNDGTPRDKKLDSGGTFWVKCYSSEEINNLPKIEASTGLEYCDIKALPWHVAFHARDNEFIKEGKIIISGGGLTTPVEAKVDGADNIGWQSGNTTHDETRGGTIDLSSHISLRLDQTYNYYIKFDIYKLKQTTSSAPIVPAHETYVESNKCQFKKGTNPTDSIGGQTENPTDNPDPKTKEEGECYSECSRALSPVRNALCYVQCAMLDMILGFFDLAFRLLEGAVGLS